jgi:hypothetical protein
MMSGGTVSRARNLRGLSFHVPFTGLPIGEHCIDIDD